MTKKIETLIENLIMQAIETACMPDGTFNAQQCIDALQTDTHKIQAAWNLCFLNCTPEEITILDKSLRKLLHDDLAVFLDSNPELNLRFRELVIQFLAKSIALDPRHMSSLLKTATKQAAADILTDDPRRDAFGLLCGELRAAQEMKFIEEHPEFIQKFTTATRETFFSVWQELAEQMHLAGLTTEKTRTTLPGYLLSIYTKDCNPLERIRS